MTKEDKRTGRQTGRGGRGRGNYGGGTSPAGALAHVPCCHTKGGSIRVGLKDGGKRERYVYIFYFFCSKRTNYCVSQCSWLREVGVSLKGNELVNCAPDGAKWTAQNITE